MDFLRILYVSLSFLGMNAISKIESAEAFYERETTQSSNEEMGIKKKSYYDIFGIKPTASNDEIEGAFNRLSAVYNPVHYKEEYATKFYNGVFCTREVMSNLFDKLCGIRFVLLNFELRKRYDATLPIEAVCHECACIITNQSDYDDHKLVQAVPMNLYKGTYKNYDSQPYICPFSRCNGMTLESYNEKESRETAKEDVCFGKPCKHNGENKRCVFRKV